MDPIGTVRRENHKDDGGYSIWMRQHPGYPDSEMIDTEWTCVWSTAPGNFGARLGDDITAHSVVIGGAPGTPAQTGADVQRGDRVETLPGALYWTDEPVQGRVIAVGVSTDRHVTIEFDEPQHLKGEFPATYTHWGMFRQNFRLLDEDS